MTTNTLNPRAARSVIEFDQPDDMTVPDTMTQVTLDNEHYVMSGLGPNENNVCTLLGFGPAGEQTITVFREEAEQDPSKVIGMTPTFSDGHLFVWNLRVREFRMIDQNKN